MTLNLRDIKRMERPYTEKHPRLSLIEVLLQDARYAFRMMRKAPAFTTMALITLALGIGANTAIFSVIESVLGRSLNYPESERLFSIREVVPKLSHLYPT